MQNLWGDEFIVPETKSKVDEVLEKIKNPEQIDKDELKKIARSKKIDIKDKLEVINKYTKQLLGEHIKDTLVIKSKEQLVRYVDKVIQDGILAYDTETNNSLDAWTGEIIGLCLYSPSNQPAYVPIKHIDYLTRELRPNQVSVEDCKEQLQRIVDNKVYVIMHNGKFDYKFTKTNYGVELPINWDTMIATRMIDENEINAGLKYQYKDKIDNLHPIYDIEEVFPVEYVIVDPDIFALYSATDSLMTYKLFKYQEGILYQPEQKNVLKLFKDIEMPLTIVTAEMELDGIKVDKEYSDRLLTKYTKVLEEKDKKLENEIANIQKQIDDWRKTPEANEKPKVYPTAKVKDFKNYPYVDNQGKHYKLGKSKNETLEEPINVESPQQLAILLYDVLKYEPASIDNPRSTDKYALEVFDEERHSSLCKVIRERRVIATLLNDFIVKLPGLINSRTGKIHCNFNQLGKEDKGVVTGRFSSSDPNLQQIPSHNYEVRLLFCGDNVEHTLTPTNDYYIITNGDEILMQGGEWVEVKDIHIGDILNNNGKVVDVHFENDKYLICTNDETQQELKTRTPYMLCGSDYSAQEPRLTAFYSQDPIMRQAYLDKKDLYSVIAQSMYKNNYEDNLEFYPEGTHITIDGQDIVTGFKTHKNKDGKARRSAAKTVLLGMTYGRGAFSIAEQLGKPKEEGQKIIDDFFGSFPKVKELIDKTQNKAKTLGYVEDWYGRRRHLKDMKLPKYTIEYTNEYKKTHNTFNPILICENRVESSLIDKYTQLVQNVRGKKQLQELTQKALSEGVRIIDNSGFISRAERQCLNSIVQGGAATLTKLAMVNIYNDKELNELGLRMLVPIHDELLCTCPKINAEKASERLVQVMIDTAKPYIDVPMSCDPYVVSHWYWDELTNQVQNEFDDLQENLTKEEAFEKMKEIHSELLENDLKDMLNLK